MAQRVSNHSKDEWFVDYGRDLPIADPYFMYDI